LVAAGAAAELHSSGRRIDRTRGGGCTACGDPVGEGALDPVESVEHGSDIGGRRFVGQLHQGHLEQQPRIRRMTHVDEDLPQSLHRLDDLARSQPYRLIGHERSFGIGQRDELGSHQ
jgi:hypothetical protein